MADFVNVCGLYRCEAKSGRVVHFGTWGKTRIYVTENERATPASIEAGTQPEYWLAIRHEDYDPAKHGPKLEVTV